jgi:hypothetical protein
VLCVDVGVVRSSGHPGVLGDPPATGGQYPAGVCKDQPQTGVPLKSNLVDGACGFDGEFDEGTGATKPSTSMCGQSPGWTTTGTLRQDCSARIGSKNGWQR